MYDFAVLEASHLVGCECDVVRPFALEVGTSEFALSPRHRRGTAYRRHISVLNSMAAFSMAACLSGASTVLSQMALLATL
jgi:hypothetical protein